MIKTLVTFLFGAAAGAGVSYLYLKPKFEEENAINAEKNRHHYEEKLKEFYAEHPETCNVDDISEPTEEVIEDKKPEGLRKAEELASKLNYNQLYNKEPLGNGGFETKEDNVYLISPEQYESETLLDRRTLTYYEGDDILCDELSEEVLDIENTIGIENIGEFGNSFEDDPYLMHIRNNTFGCVYEIFKDERSYSAVMGENE